MIANTEFSDLLDNMPALAELEYSIDTASSAHIMGMLRNMYADPHYAVVREYLSNALDSHRVADVDEPVEISVPNSFCQELRIRDYGVGLDAEEAEALFVYGRSGHNKRSSNQQLGHFGIGCKSGFSVSSVFSIYTYKDGCERVWSAYLDMQGIGRAKLVSESFTGARDGVMIAIPAKKEEFEKFQTAVASAVRLLDVDVKVDNELFQPLTRLRACGEVVIEDRHPTGLRTTYVFTDTFNYATPFNLCVGGFVYAIPNSVYTSLNKPHYVDLYIDVPIGSVSVTPSRDSLMLDAATQARCLAEIKRAIDALPDVAQRYVDGAPTVSEAIQRRGSLHRAVSGTPDDGTVLWRGELIDCLAAMRVDDVWNYAKQAANDLVGDGVVACSLAASRRGNILRLAPLPVQTFFGSRYARQPTHAFFTDGQCVLHDDAKLFTVETHEDTRYSQVATATRKLVQAYSAHNAVFLIGPAEALAGLTRGGVPVTRLVTAAAVINTKLKGNTRATVKAMMFKGADLEQRLLLQALPSAFWEPCSSRKIDWENTIWVPSFACRIDKSHIPSNLCNSLYFKRPIIGNIALAKIQRALRHVDASIRIATGGESKPAGSLSISSAITHIIRKYDAGKRPGALHPAFITLRHADTQLRPTWLFAVLASSAWQYRSYILTHAKRAGTLRRLTRIIADLAGDDTAAHRDYSEEEHLTCFFRYYAVRLKATDYDCQFADSFLRLRGPEARAELIEAGAGEIGKILMEVSRLWYQLQEEVPFLQYLDAGTTSEAGRYAAIDALCALERVNKKEK